MDQMHAKKAMKHEKDIFQAQNSKSIKLPILHYR